MFTAELVIKITRGAGGKSVERKFQQTDDSLDDLREMFVASVFQRGTTTVESLFDQAQEEFAKKEPEKRAARKAKKALVRAESPQESFAKKEAERSAARKAKKALRAAKPAAGAPEEGEDA